MATNGSVDEEFVSPIAERRGRAEEEDGPEKKVRTHNHNDPSRELWLVCSLYIVYKPAANACGVPCTVPVL